MRGQYDDGDGVRRTSWVGKSDRADCRVERLWEEGGLEEAGRGRFSFLSNLTASHRLRLASSLLLRGGEAMLEIELSICCLSPQCEKTCPLGNPFSSPRLCSGRQARKGQLSAPLAPQ
jgi:hypothetical protein